MFSGRWTAESPGPDGITRLEFGSNASAIFIRVWAACQQGECDWGQTSIDISAAGAGVLSFTFAPPGRIDTLKISLLPDRRLRAAWHTTYADPRPPQDRTQEFAWFSVPTWRPLSDVPTGAWPAVSSSVVVFVAKHPAGQLEPVGSGLLVSQGLVATSYNVVKNATQLQARRADQNALWPILEVVKVDEAHDVAFVRIEGLCGWPLRLNVSRELAVKDPVFVITNVTDETVALLAISSVSVVNGVSHIEISAPLSPIESGAPVFNKYGSVVGISASNPEGAKKPGLVIPATRLTALMPALAGSGAVQTMAKGLLPYNFPVDSWPVMLNKPEPRFTEEARRRGFSGGVTMQILVGADGKVKMVEFGGGLPYGLDEPAIQAAYQMRFKPAIRDGRPVEYWLPVSIEFNFKAH